jgi:hypothetical protein
VYLSEIFPNLLRPQGVALGLSAFYLASEASLVAAPVALNKIGWRFYLVLICPSMVYITTMYFLFPETKGRTVEEIGDLFGDEKHVASHWYNATPEEKERFIQQALEETKGGVVHETMHEELESEVAEKGSAVLCEEAGKD